MTAADTGGLLQRLTDDDPEVRLQAILQAGEPDDVPAPAAVVESLVRMLSHEHPGLNQASLETLSRLIEAQRAAVGPEALHQALRLSRHESPRVRAEAIAALGVFCPEVESSPRAQRLLEAFGDEDPEVRRTAAAAAGDFGLAEARAPLAEALASKDTRFEAAFALAALKDPRARPVLEAALTDKRTRLDALEALRRLGDPAARDAVRALTDAWLTPWVDRLSAWATLHVLEDPTAGDHLVARARSRRMEERVYAMFLLGRYKVPAGRDLLHAVAQSPSDPQVETAIDALGWLDDPPSAALLARLADDPKASSDVRFAAERALARMTTPEASAARARRPGPSPSPELPDPTDDNA